MQNINYLKLQQFIDKKTSLEKLIVIYWPTWSWKTSLSIDIASFLDTQIISLDSRQIYKYLDIWTWKITEEEKKWIFHHMIDIITPDISYSVWEFKTETTKIINNMFQYSKIPVLIWWTWLYIDSIIYDFDIPKIPADENLRKTLFEEYLKYWALYIYKKLQDIDPLYRQTVHPNNINYVIRWIEVKTLSWKSKLDFKKDKKLKYDVLFLTPYDWNREKLYNKINLRVKKMFDDWFMQEVQKLLNMWYNRNSPWFKTIWYLEILDYLEWKISLNKCIELVSQLNRNYAKRQLTWIWNKYI